MRRPTGLTRNLAAFREETARLANSADGKDPFVALTKEVEWLIIPESIIGIV